LDGAIETSAPAEEAVENLKELATKVVSLSSYQGYINEAGDCSQHTFEWLHIYL
ncbi:hypothetical protein K7432_012866, partial [Basidiobolus ranarum]